MRHHAQASRPARDVIEAPTPITFTLTGDVTEEEVDRAREVFNRVLAHAHEPVLYVRVTLTKLAEPAPPRGALASLRADVNGRVHNAHAAAGNLHEAIAMTADRLAIRLERTSRDWEARRGHHHR
ncbi:hypothetical protein ACGFNU_47325 [Spirillospora sp. NPDC048911]|uniref:hypothetical protein n=1 Tax=Spirillospora sp. NPDC048911 TaxID=3364527 RepID=UPI00371D9D61